MLRITRIRIRDPWSVSIGARCGIGALSIDAAVCALVSNVGAARVSQRCSLSFPLFPVYMSLAIPMVLRVGCLAVAPVVLLLGVGKLRSCGSSIWMFLSHTFGNSHPVPPTLVPSALGCHSMKTKIKILSSQSSDNDKSQLQLQLELELLEL